MVARNRFFTEPKKTPKRRPMRVGEAIRMEIAQMLHRSISDPRLRHVTISNVDVTDDLKVAKVFYECVDEEAEASAIGFESAKGFIRSHLADSLGLRYVPELIFKRDVALARKVEIERLLREIANEEG